MKKIFIPFCVLLSINFGCKSYFVVSPIGDLTMISTRNVETDMAYDNIKTYAGIDKKQIENEIAASRKGRISRKSPLAKEINTFKAKTLNECVDNVVKSVAGGEFLKNARFYYVIEYRPSFNAGTMSRDFSTSVNYIASGDVWGVKTANADIKGFRANDNVIFTYDKELKKSIGKVFSTGELNQQYEGTIIELKSTTAMIKLKEATAVVEIPYTKLTKF
jgi:hypothetical protein